MKAANQELEKLIETITKHIEAGECGQEEVELARLAFMASLWSEEAKSALKEAIHAHFLEDVGDTVAGIITREVKGC